MTLLAVICLTVIATLSGYAAWWLAFYGRAWAARQKMMRDQDHERLTPRPCERTRADHFCALHRPKNAPTGSTEPAEPYVNER